MPKENTAKPLAQHQTLTAYEAGQLAQIAAWKSESRGVAKRLLRTVAGPLGSLPNKVLPQGAVQSAMDGVNKMAGQLARDDSILKDSKLKAQGITSLEDIAARPLEFADTVADRITHDAGNIALGMGAAASPDERAQTMANYQRQIETTFLHQAVEESSQNALQRAVLGAELGALIPGFGIAFSAYLNPKFIHHVGIAGIPRTLAAQPRQGDVDNPSPEANKIA